MTTLQQARDLRNWTFEEAPTMQIEDVDDVRPDAEGPPPLAVWLRRQADAYGSRNDPRARFLSERIAEMETLAYFLGAATPEEYLDRIEVLERGR